MISLSARSVLVLLAFAVFSSAPEAWAQDGFSEEDVLRALTTGTETTKLAALDALENYGQDPRVAEVLLKALKKADTEGAVPDSTLWMLIRLGKFTDRAELPEMMLGYLESSNPKVRMVAADTLGAIGHREAADAIEDLIGTPEYDGVYGYRKCLLHALMKLEHPKAITILIEQLPKLTGQLEYEVVRYLSHVSRQRFGTNAELWKTWWRDNFKDFNFNETNEPFSLEVRPAEDFAWNREVAEFFGTYIYAKKLIFVLDMSSSMRAGAGQGTRLDMAKQELIEAIQKLPEDTYFTIVLFDARVTPWNRRLVAATESIREKAVAWVSRIQTGKGTASYDALDRSFRIDGNTEAIFFLSDGQPSKGTITDPHQILVAVGKENYFRRIAIYSFGFDGAGGSGFMRSLAEQNKGTYTSVQ